MTASNVVFAAQEDPAAIKPADDPSGSPNPLSSTYGGWMAVENAGMSVYKAAQTRNVDTMLEAVDEMTVACGNCHEVYREKSERQGGLAARCTK